jgi:hypothetical protein
MTKVGLGISSAFSKEFIELSQKGAGHEKAGWGDGLI